TDGGKTWNKVLFRNDSTGAADLSLDAANPSVLYAGLWQAQRRPWTLVSGGVGSGLFKSTDAGEHWIELTKNPGLPTGLWGNIGIAVSPAKPARVWALIEADSGGVYRSDDSGSTWKWRRRSSITSRPRTTFRIACAARSRTTPACADPAAGRAGSTGASGTTCPASRAISRPGPITPTSPTAGTTRDSWAGWTTRPTASASSARGRTAPTVTRRRKGSTASSGPRRSWSRRTTPACSITAATCSSRRPTRGRAGRWCHPISRATIPRRSVLREIGRAHV